MDDTIVYYGFGQTARFKSWDASQRTDTLLLWAHGMQRNAFYEPIVAGRIPIPPRNYAFTIPFNTALFNPAFTNQENWPRLRLFVNRFLIDKDQFSSCAPFLYIYPFINIDQNILNALSDLASYNLCDILYLNHLSNLAGNVDYITFEQFLRAPVGGEGVTYAERYSSFLLLTCRSSVPPYQIGLGGAAPTSPKGLYPVDNGPRRVYIP